MTGNSLCSIFTSRPLDEVISAVFGRFSMAFRHAPTAFSYPKMLSWPGREMAVVKFSQFGEDISCRCRQVMQNVSSSSRSNQNVAGIASILKSTTARSEFSACTSFEAHASKVVLQVEEESEGMLQVEEELDNDGSGWAPELQIEEVLVGGRHLKIVQPKDVDEVIDMYIKQNRLDRDPYWARLWPSAIAMSEEILANPGLVAGRRVCDLGAGLGLPALAALLAGAKEVVLYDREPLALQCALLSMHANIPGLVSNLPLFLPLKPHQSEEASQDFPPSSTSSPESANPSTFSSVFLQDIQPRCLASLEKLLPWLPSLTTDASFRVNSVSKGLASEGADARSKQVVLSEIADWGDKSIQNKDFDVVLACDVLYESASVDLIADLVPRLLTKRSGAKLIVTDPVERCPQNRKRFIDLMQTGACEGIVMESMERREPLFENGIHQIELMHFSRCSISILSSLEP